MVVVVVVVLFSFIVFMDDSGGEHGERNDDDGGNLVGEKYRERVSENERTKAKQKQCFISNATQFFDFLVDYDDEKDDYDDDDDDDDYYDADGVCACQTTRFIQLYLIKHKSFFLS